LPAARIGDSVKGVRRCGGTGHIDNIFHFWNISSEKFPFCAIRLYGGV
jgi:hypothetical protein